MTAVSPAVMTTMKAAQISKAGGQWELVERPLPEPGPGQVRIRVEACGICHGDMMVKEGHWPGLQYPRVPGHEIAGRVDCLGPGVTAWSLGQRVGVGWHGGHCFQCEHCRRGHFILCRNGKITGISHDGGYAEYMLSPAEALAAVPNELPAAEAGPLMCAGITTFNSLRNSGARPGDLVAIQGVGGLGHVAIQYARRMGFNAVAVGRGSDKQPLALKLGARQYIDSEAGSVAEALQRLGGAQVIVATAPDAQSISTLVGGLAPGGKLLVVGGALEPLSISALALIGGQRIVQGWNSGTAMDSEDTLRFSALENIRPLIETFPLARVAEAYERMASGKARFRVVLTMT